MCRFFVGKAGKKSGGDRGASSRKARDERNALSESNLQSLSPTKPLVAERPLSLFSPQMLCPPKNESIEDKGDGDDLSDGEDRFEVFFEQEAEESGGNGSENKLPTELGGMIFWVYPPFLCGSPKTLDDGAPVFPIKNKKNHSRGKMRDDQEDKKSFIMPVQIPPKKRGEEHAMSET